MTISASVCSAISASTVCGLSTYTARWNRVEVSEVTAHWRPTAMHAHAIASSRTARVIPPCSIVGAPLNAPSSSKSAVTRLRSVSRKNGIFSPASFDCSQTKQFVSYPRSSLCKRIFVTAPP